MTFLTNRLNRPTDGFPVYHGRYSTDWNLSREEKEDLEQAREKSARNPFMYRFTLKVLRALEHEAKQRWYKVLDAACNVAGTNPEELPMLRERLKAIQDIVIYYQKRLLYFSEGTIL